ncbi:uncharacterized protein LOC114357639 [Ostrinia furnacalis]|uniref:uncharacterized protein LOC114357639 n=1 Tax=Ostrinia furnacalis TaxID=93504 RepID=UPI00103D166B|nr:uncharacterized protein LOC114357639 [Ostrinia furnacalis]
MSARRTGVTPDVESSPVNWANVYQEASNLLPPRDEPAPPGRPVRPQPHRPPGHAMHMTGHEGFCFIKRSREKKPAETGFTRESSQNSFASFSDAAPKKFRFKHVFRNLMLGCFGFHKHLS